MARIAESLAVLRNEINDVAPNRNKASDGWLGDAAHAATRSDHNPNAAGVVCAFDFTHSPSTGMDAHAWADHIRAHRHPALKYIISNRRIASSRDGWAWRQYFGSNPHSSHVHVSVGVGSDGSSTGPYDDRSSWGISTPPPLASEETEMIIFSSPGRPAFLLSGNEVAGFKEPEDLSAFVGAGVKHLVLSSATYHEFLRVYRKVD